MPSARRLHWTNTAILATFHLLAVAAVLYLIFVQASPWTIALGVTWLALCGLSITGGYHRLFAHSTYQARAWLRAFYLLFGAASVQNSVLCWANDHRIHHARPERHEDPYSIQRGFWWAHIGWVLFHDDVQVEKPRAVRDLQKDPLVRLQHRFYVPLAILMGALLPGALGLLWGDPIGAILVAGFLRLVVQWHSTFAVNSLAHCVGVRPFSATSTARDCFVTALVTLGEGYHNFHHRFQRDYRNGIRWYHFDPTKWFVWTMSLLGVTRGLRRTPAAVVDRARRDARAARV